MSQPAPAVLVVDDSLTVRMDLVDTLAAAGFAPTACATLAEARGALAARRFDLILLDVQLPDGEGFELLAELRGAAGADGPRAETPVMILSSEAEVAHRVRGLELGAAEYVGKPYDPAQVLGRARGLLERGAARQVTRPRLLVIDDSPTVREEVREALEEGGYEVTLAASGEEGLRVAAGLTPDAVVIDYTLPGIDGPAVIRRLRADARLRHVPCVLLTGSDGADQLHALDSGADAWLSKGEGCEVLLMRLAGLLRTRPRPDPERPSLLAPKRLLVVDDSLTFRQQLGEALREEGYDVALAPSGEEALRLLEVQPIDCVLLDVVMEGLSGHDTCRLIRARKPTGELPVIMITAHDDRESLIDSINSGADDYIGKSADVDVLKARVRAQLRRKQSEDEHRRAREELLQKELEAVEARTARELAALLERKNSELQEQNRRVEEATRQKSEFLANMSHELRTPLNAIIGFSELIEDEKVGPLNEVQREYMGDVLTSARHLLQLINDVLDLSKVEAGRMTFRPEQVDLSRLVAEVRDVTRGLSARRAIELRLEVEEGLTAFLDPGRLKQVLFNYVSNALKFTPERGHVTVRVRGDGPDRFRVEVEDEGIGIAPADLERLFVAFEQLDAGAGKRYQGTGLGLALTRQIVTSQGGTVGVESAPGRGSTFWAGLPRRVAGPSEGGAR